MVYMKSMVRARHEMGNARLKTFNALKYAWRHDRSHHRLAFRCIVIMVQLNLESGGALPKVTYSPLKPIVSTPEEEGNEEEVEPL